MKNDSLQNNEITRGWIKISISALAISGIYSIILVLLRAPIFNSLIADKSIFNMALVIHVDLSVLFWMLCISAYFITSSIAKNAETYIKTIQNFLYISLILICFAPLMGEAQPFLNNYVPMLHNLSFVMGIALFFGCFVILSLIGLLYKSSAVAKSTSLIILISMISFVISAHQLKSLTYPLDLHSFYEMVFWGCGHIIQFVYTQSLICVWYEYKLKDSKIIKLDLLLWLNCLFTLPLPFIQILTEIDSPRQINMFTEHMRIFGGIVPSIAVLVIISSSFTAKNKAKINFIKKTFIFQNNLPSLENASFNLSVLLFLMGGVIGLLISGTNVTIPAHYHGAIVGISIAFMGYVYSLITKHYTAINFKTASWQLFLYAFGQLIHILGLAYSGGYGALRKTPGSEFSLKVKIAMSVMGLGGLIAIIAGLMFVVICGKTIFNANQEKIKV